MTSAALMLDAANACREVSMVVALVLARTDGDLDAALVLLDGLPNLEPAATNELDARSIAAQAIRDARQLRTGDGEDG